MTWRCGHPKEGNGERQCAFCQRVRAMNWNAEQPRKGTLTLGKKIALGLIE